MIYNHIKRKKSESNQVEGDTPLFKGIETPTPQQNRQLANSVIVKPYPAHLLKSNQD